MGEYVAYVFKCMKYININGFLEKKLLARNRLLEFSFKQDCEYTANG